MPIHITKTSLPPLDDYVARLKRVWASGHVTNHGPEVCELERRLAGATGMRHAVAVSSGAMALHIAIRALELEGSELITTPFSYVATTATMVWEGCRPRFADVLAADLTIDPESIRALVTPETRGIVATHVYGFPCDVDAIATIAGEHRLGVIYDAAHCWGVRYRGESLFAHGDIAILSMHATKILHSGEGGVLFTNDERLAERACHLRNFGHEGYEDFWGLGTNGKMSELHAALGLCMLDLVDGLIGRRQEAAAAYDRALACETSIERPVPRAGTQRTWAFYPILLEDEETVKRVQARLSSAGIFARRYFFPSLTQLPYCGDASAPLADAAARRVLCLPVSAELDEASATRIAGLVIAALKEAGGSRPA